MLPPNDVLLFIDANIYLDLYRIEYGKKLIPLLASLTQHVFITQQIANEVNRNTIKAAMLLLKDKFKEVQLQAFPIQHPLSAPASQNDKINALLIDVEEKIRLVNRETKDLPGKILNQISHSEDEVSIALKGVFAKAVAPSQEELTNARLRKELGNPPGKKDDPLGDQLSWEQLLTKFKGKKRLWIISRDSDYAIPYNKGQRVLNSFLYDELCRICHNPEIYLYDDLLTGLKHFVDTTGIQEIKFPSAEDIANMQWEFALIQAHLSAEQLAATFVPSSEQWANPPPKTVGEARNRLIAAYTTMKNQTNIDLSIPAIESPLTDTKMQEVSHVLNTMAAAYSQTTVDTVEKVGIALSTLNEGQRAILYQPKPAIWGGTPPATIQNAVDRLFTILRPLGWTGSVPSTFGEIFDQLYTWLKDKIKP